MKLTSSTPSLVKSKSLWTNRQRQVTVGFCLKLPRRSSRSGIHSSLPLKHQSQGEEGKNISLQDCYCKHIPAAFSTQAELGNQSCASPHHPPRRGDQIGSHSFRPYSTFRLDE